MSVLQQIEPVQGKQGVMRFLPGFPSLLAAVLVMIACYTVRDRFSDLDLWWHLKAGELISNTHALPKSDPFSYSAPQAQWVTQEWLSEVSIYQAYAVAGNQGLALWLFTLSAGIVAAGYGLCFLCCRNPRIAFLGGMLIWMMSTIGLAIRPHMVGYFLLTLELIILNLALRRRPRWLITLPVIFLLWVNLHSSFFLGFVVLCLFVAISFFHFECGSVQFLPWSRSSRNALLLAFALSALALFVNPVGTKLLRYPLEVLFSQPLSVTHVNEWRPPDLTSPRGFVLVVSSLLVVLLPLFARKRIYGHELALFLAGLWLALRHQRMIFVFGIFVAPILCRLVRKIWDKRQPKQDRVVLNAVAFAAIGILLLRTFPGSADLEKQINRDNPVEALSFVRNAKLAGPMMNDYDFGGYLIWAAPERKVFIDGRSDMYEPAGVMSEYTDWIDLHDTRGILDKYRVSYCLLARNARIAGAVARLPGWKQIYSDAKAVVIVRQN